MKWMNRKTLSSTLLTFTFALSLSSGLVAKDKLDILDNRAGKMMAPALDQTYVYHTNGNLWMGWDSYGNTGDQTCSAIIPGWIYPGSFSMGGHGYLNYNCRAGYWIIAKIGGDFVEGTTGEYVLSRGTEPGPTSQGWADSDTSYNKEPWISNSTWYIPDANLTVNAVRKSWSFPGSNFDYFNVGNIDYNDFVVEEISVINTGSTDIDELVLGSKADHDCTWNVPYPDWDAGAYWTDDIVDYDQEYLLTMELDGDDQTSASNDFGIDDPNHEYRGVRVGQIPLEINGVPYTSLSASDVNHMWWTGDEDPQTAAARYAMATMVSGSGDKKEDNPPPMDMRYLQSYSVSPLAAGDTATFVIAVLAGAGLANTKQAAKNARQAYDFGFDLPKPPAAPQIASDGIQSSDDGLSVVVTWSYSNAQMEAEDPDNGNADFAGFRVYKSAQAPRVTSESLGLAADDLNDGGEMRGDVTKGMAFSPNATGPYTLIADISYDGSSFSLSSSAAGTFMKMGETYMYTDPKVAIGLKYWYYVAAYDEGGTSANHGTVDPLESYYTMCYALTLDPYGSDLIPSHVPSVTVSVSGEMSYTDLSGKTTTDVLVTPNPWKAETMETYHGSSTAAGFFIRFYNLEAGDVVRIFDVTGNLVYESDKIATGANSLNWNLVSRTQNQVVTGVYYWHVKRDNDNQTGKLAVIR